MQLTRLYDESDRERFETERVQHIETHKNKLRLTGVPEELHETIARQMAAASVAPMKIRAMEVVHTGASQKQHFSVRSILQGLDHGYFKIEGDRLTLKAEPEDLVYSIQRRPGRYCLHCGEKLPDDTKGELALLHVFEKHHGVESPDPKGHPAGYEMINYFDVTLDGGQHERHKSDVSTLKRLEGETKQPGETSRNWFSRVFGGQR